MEKSVIMCSDNTKKCSDNPKIRKYNRDNTLFDLIGHVRYISYRVKNPVIPVIILK